MKQKQLPFLLLTIAFLLFVISPYWLSKGMFCDGLIYAVISNNLAHGQGTLWDLFFTSGLGQHFHGHPPLAFGLESLFYSVLGDGYLVEKIYSTTTYIITGIIVVNIWKQVAAKRYFSLFWLPLVLWLSVPLAWWSISNNMLENTMMIFTTMAIYFGVKSYKKNRVVNIMLSGFMVFLAVLTKGPTGLFPLALPFWVFLIDKKISFSRSLLDTILLLAALTGSFLFTFLLFPAGFDSLIIYFNTQVVASVGNIATVSNRFYIIGRMLSELIPMYVALLLVAVFARKIKWKDTHNPWVYVLLMTGLSGVVPIIISLKQSGFYIVPVFPVIAIAFSLFIVPGVKGFTDRINTSKHGFILFKYVSYLMLLIGLVVNLMQINNFGRNRDMLEDVYSIGSIVPNGLTVSVERRLIDDWLLVGYFWRYDKIGFDAETPFTHDYLIVKKDYSDTLLSNFKKRYG